MEQGDAGDEQVTAPAPGAPKAGAPPSTTSMPKTQTGPIDPQPDASKLRKMSMSGENAAKLAREQFKYVLPVPVTPFSAQFNPSLDQGVGTIHEECAND